MTPVEVGKWFEARLIDIGRGGVQLGTDWALSRGDLLAIQLLTGDGKVKERHIRVVRVRSGTGSSWCAGACFIDP